MSETKISNFSFTDRGVIVSGSTQFEMNITTFTGSNYIIPDFTKSLTGTIKLDEETSTVELRKIPLQEAKSLIYKYIKEHPGSRTSDLIIELALDPDIVVEALSQLRCEGRIGGKDVGSK